MITDVDIKSFPQSSIYLHYLQGPSSCILLTRILLSV